MASSAQLCSSSLSCVREYLVTDSGIQVTDSGRQVTDSGRQVTDGGRYVYN